MLGPAGAINHWLREFGIIDRPLDLLYSWTGIAIALTYVMLPLMVLTVSSVLQNIDRALLAASADLGGGPLATFITVTFPLVACPVWQPDHSSSLRSASAPTLCRAS